VVLPVQPTRGELRVRLASRLGYAANPGSANQGVLNDLLDDAHSSVYEEMTGWAPVIADAELMTVAGQWAYDWPDTVDVDRIEYMLIHLAPDQVLSLTEGFTALDYDYRDTYRSYPLRYRRRAMLEVSPVPDAAYRIVIGAQARLVPLTDDEQTLVVPHEVVLRKAVLLGREQQGRPIPQVVLADYNARMTQLRARAHRSPYYLPGGAGALQGLPRPQAAAGVYPELVS